MNGAIKLFGGFMHFFHLSLNCFKVATTGTAANTIALKCDLGLFKGGQLGEAYPYCRLRFTVVIVTIEFLLRNKVGRFWGPICH